MCVSHLLETAVPFDASGSRGDAAGEIKMNRPMVFEPKNGWEACRYCIGVCDVRCRHRGYLCVQIVLSPRAITALNHNWVDKLCCTLRAFCHVFCSLGRFEPEIRYALLVKRDTGVEVPTQFSVETVVRSPPET